MGTGYVRTHARAAAAAAARAWSSCSRAWNSERTMASFFSSCVVSASRSASQAAAFCAFATSISGTAQVGNTTRGRAWRGSPDRRAARLLEALLGIV